MWNQILKQTSKNLKTKIMSDVQKERSKHADSIIRNHILFSMGAGIIPVPVVDIFAVSAAQLDMIRQLCRVYDVDFAETQGKAIVSSLTTATLARVGAGSLAKLIPVVGSLVGGITNSALAGASTYALGEVFKAHFETGGTILDFDPDRLKKLYKEKFEKGKKVAEELRHQQEQKKKAMQDAAAEVVSEPEPESKAEPQKPANGTSVIDKLKELGALKSAGLITEEEFQKMKQKLLDQF
ncbi:MAG: DUF697 domain-containing protein [Bacteroidetes bacterium]|nr:MAG: DUF697 domain-containing protein [Bacteroidota bacterium]